MCSIAILHINEGKDMDCCMFKGMDCCMYCESKIASQARIAAKGSISNKSVSIIHSNALLEIVRAYIDPDRKVSDARALCESRT